MKVLVVDDGSSERSQKLRDAMLSMQCIENPVAQPPSKTEKLFRTCKRVGCSSRYYYSEKECDRHV